MIARRIECPTRLEWLGDVRELFIFGGIAPQLVEQHDHAEERHAEAGPIVDPHEEELYWITVLPYAGAGLVRKHASRETAPASSNDTLRKEDCQRMQSFD